MKTLIIIKSVPFQVSFKNEFGAGQIKEEYYANLAEEVTLAGYRRHLAVEAAPGPLSRQEEEMKEVKESEARVEISVDTKHNTLSALAFPFQQPVLECLEQYHGGNFDYIQMAIGTLLCFTYLDSLAVRASKKSLWILTSH